MGGLFFTSNPKPKMTSNMESNMESNVEPNVESNAKLPKNNTYFFNKFRTTYDESKKESKPSINKDTVYNSLSRAAYTTDEREKRFTEQTGNVLDKTYSKALTTQEEMFEKAKKESLTADSKIARNQTVSTVLFVTLQAANAFSSFPGVSVAAGILSLGNEIQKARIKDIKFKRLLFDVMNIITNCFKIFMLINRSTDVFTIAIHGSNNGNNKGLNELCTMLIDRRKGLNQTTIHESEVEFEKTFSKILQTASIKKTKDRNSMDVNNNQVDQIGGEPKFSENDPRYLLYNIHQSDEIKEHVKRKMDELMAVLLECAPDSIILTLFMDKTLKQNGLGDVIMNECERRTNVDSKFKCSEASEKKVDEQITAEMIKEDELSDELEDVVEELKKYEKQGVVSRAWSATKSAASSVKNTVTTNATKSMNKIKEKAKKAIDWANKMSELDNNVEKCTTLLSSINGLFMVMKTQYDEAMDYYERHLDNILSYDFPENNKNILAPYIRNNSTNNAVNSIDLDLANLSTYDKARMIIEYSNEFINFMVPQKLQSAITEAINAVPAGIINDAMIGVKNEIIDNKNDNTIKKNAENAAETLEKLEKVDIEKTKEGSGNGPIGGKSLRKTKSKRSGTRRKHK